jgi:hypothetical protein
MSAALVVMEDNRHSSTYTEAENLARNIISRMDSVTAKLKNLEDDIRRLWLEFDKLKSDETILGCATKKEFCERKLNRTPRAVRYMLDGGNLSNQRTEEIISPIPAPPAEPSQYAAKADQPKRPAPVYHAPTKPETHWISKENGCPSGKRAFDSVEALHEARKAEGKPQPVAYFNCRQCGRIHMDKGQTADRHVTFYPAPPAPSAPAKPKPVALTPEEKQAADLQAFAKKSFSRDATVTVCTRLAGLSPFHFKLEIDGLEEKDLRAAVTAAFKSRQQRQRKASR